MSSALVMRPGFARGSCPERSETEEPALARTIARALDAWRGPTRAAARRVADLAAAIDAEAIGLDALEEAELTERIGALRAELVRFGLRDEALRRGFALVREVARRTLGTPHYDVQLFGAWIMLHGNLAELETGEGKTLTASLPAALAALAGIPVHVITANDYLVERDAESLRPLYERLGLRVGQVVEAEPDRDARRAAYACDITYVTNKQVAFDYLRDKMTEASAPARKRFAARLETCESEDASERPVLRGLCFAIVDEADSVMIDDAATPLILSREGSPPDEASVRRALELARSLTPESDYRLDRARGELEITPAGVARLDALGSELEGALAGSRRRAEWVRRALHAEHLLERDRHFVVEDGAVQLIDLPTGRRSPDRAFEGDLQALLEARLGLELSARRETVARITYQSFFRRYLQLAGMTGTAREVAGELAATYRLRTVAVPTRLPSRRRNFGASVYATLDEKWNAAVAEIRALHEAGRPVLVGSSSVASSEELSARLGAAGLEHALLNARQDRSEAEVVSAAGRPGAITVATRMAGRGTDIQLSPESEAAGGLAVIATECSEARRIDRQLFGRCARQGQPGSHQQLFSLEDLHTGDAVTRALAAWLARFAPREGPLRGVLRWAALALTLRKRRADEARSARARRRLGEWERQSKRLLAFASRRD